MKYDVLLESGDGYISESRVENRINEGWEVIAFAVSSSNQVLMYFRRPKPNQNIAPIPRPY